MTARKSPWVCGLLYINENDARLLVPLPSKLGWAVNFGNPRSVTALFWIWSCWSLVFILLPVTVHAAQFARDPTPLLWLTLSLLGAFAVVRLNGCFGWRDYRLMRIASFGFAAVGAGFAAQAIINGSLMLLWGADNLHWRHHLILAPVAAAAQTSGKILSLLLLQKSRPASSLHESVVHGLLIGLGFAVSEIILIYFQWGLRHVSADGLEWAFLLGVWERVSASTLHIYGTALAAVALKLERYWLIAVVVLVHASMDFVALTGLMVSAYALEAAISACAAVTWGVFLVVAQSTRNDESEPGEIRGRIGRI